MGKTSRRESRRNRPKHIRYVAEGQRLKILIATQPRSRPGGVDLSGDIALVKAALLYADSVELLSPGVSMLSEVGGLQQATAIDALGLLASLDEQTLAHLGATDLPPETFQALRGVLALQSLTRAQRRELLGGYADDPEVKRFLESTAESLQGPTEQIRAIATGLVDTSGRRELDVPIKLGLVKIRDVDLAAGDTDAMIASYVEQLKKSLEDPAIHALFDRSSASLARSLVREGHVDLHRLTLVHAKEAAVGGGLISRLPSFPTSSIDEVLELRGDLMAQLAGYRRAIVGFAGRVQSDGLDEAVAVEVEDLWRTEVAPTLDELRDGLASSSLVRSVAKQIGESPATIISGAASLGALLMGIHTATDIVSALGGPAAAGAAGSLVVRGAMNHHKEQAALRKHDLFYLHEVNSKLAQSSPQDAF